MFQDGVTQITLREVELSILNSDDCDEYAEPNKEQKYCSGWFNSTQDTCQV